MVYKVTGYTNRSSKDNDIQVVGITSIDLESKTCGGLTRERTTITIDFAYPTSGLHITPALGEQWYVWRYKGAWRLKDKIPFNDETVHIPVTQGQTKIGSSKGPVELVGKQINLHGPLVNHPVSERPTDATVGTQVWDSVLDQPIWLSKTGWIDGKGDPV